MDPTAFGPITAPTLIASPSTASPTGASPTGASATGPRPGSAAAGSFAALLGDAISRVQQVQGNAEQEVQKLLAGEPVELHRVMLASEQAGLAADLLMAVRNKVIDAYQEVMRIQV